MDKSYGWNKETSPFHRGEQALHERLGVKERQEAIGRRILRPFMLDEHRDFFAQLPFLIVGSVDADGWPWASVMFGHSGFLETPTNKTLRINGTPVQGDPLGQNIGGNSPVSILGIELPTRRRNRMNGVASKQAGGGYKIDVVQSFGNCPQYIQTRAMEFAKDPKLNPKVEAELFQALSPAMQAFIRSADTFFVASFNAEDDMRDTGGVDVNHRGGRPGFIKIDENTLTIPDYKGNNAFNTLGNFILNPKAGLLFIDFETGDLVMMVGSVDVLLDKSDEVDALPGAQRAWKFTLNRGIRLKNAAPLEWAFGEYSPRLPDLTT